ncbi:hypothetical protein D3C72_2064000 [compost metagenome]
MNWNVLWFVFTLKAYDWLPSIRTLTPEPCVVSLVCTCTPNPVALSAPGVSARMVESPNAVVPLKRRLAACRVEISQLCKVTVNVFQYCWAGVFDPLNSEMGTSPIETEPTDMVHGVLVIRP